MPRLGGCLQQLKGHRGDHDKAWRVAFPLLPAQRKTHKPELQALVKEIEAVQLELAGHEEVTSVLMNPAGTFGGYLDKVRAALR